MPPKRAMQHAMQTNTLADLLERVLDKGIVIAGDIKIRLVDVELLTIQIRLVICSVDKAKEIGIDWWTHNSAFQAQAESSRPPEYLAHLEERLARVEASCAK